MKNADSGITADTLLLRILDTVACVEATDPTKLTPPLNDVIDVEALLVAVQSDACVRVTFEYRDLTVDVYDSGQVTVSGQHEHTPASHCCRDRPSD
jgi:hypothetical protein